MLVDEVDQLLTVAKQTICYDFPFRRPPSIERFKVLLWTLVWQLPLSGLFRPDVPCRVVLRYLVQVDETASLDLGDCCQLHLFRQETGIIGSECRRHSQYDPF